MSTLVGTPVKNAGLWLPKFLEELEKLRGVSRTVFIYGESNDQTLDILNQWADTSRHEVEIFREPPLEAPTAHQLGPLYQDFQDAMTSGDETHFLLIDADITRFPADLIYRLRKHGKDIIAPYVWVNGHVPPRFFDTYCFRYKGYRFHPFNPPDPGQPFKVDSIGSCYLAKRDAFAFTPYGDRPHRSFCQNAREMGFEVWADPTTKIYHVFLEALGISRVYPEALENLPPDNTPYIKKDGSTVPLEQMGPDLLYAMIWHEVR